MKRLALALLLAILPAACAGAAIIYAEQYYQLYHEHLHHYPDDTLEDIFYLEQALKSDIAPFANPLWALATVKDQTDWARYRYLFYMHVNLKLIYCYLTLGSKYEKQDAYFYNAPWKQQNLDSLNLAEKVYRVAYGYWDQARQWSTKAWDLRDVHLEQIQEWEDESYRIETGDLDYRDIIDAALAHLAKIRAAFQAMDQSTY